jgi:uncharacterized protein (DUF1800 family)
MSVHIWPSARIAWQKADPSAASPLRVNAHRHLLSRFAFGPSPHTLARVHELHADGWWATQIRYAKAHPLYSASRRVASVGPLLDKSPSEVRQHLKSKGNEYGWDAMDQLSQVTLGLQAWSSAQLYETVVDFFANHLNVPNHNGDLWNSRHTFDRNVVRKYAFGTFTDMLLAAARNPAMLINLNNTESNGHGNGDNVNENYGRELLELHTVGAGHYTETDVRNSAYILSGRRANIEIGARSRYYFDPNYHYTGAVKVMAFKAGAHAAKDGAALGDRYLRYLASHPATAQHLAQKLCIRFVSDKPSAGLVRAIAAVYLKHKTAILPTITAIIRSTEFWESRGHKVRRPAENLIATLRILDIHPTDVAKATATLSWMTSSMGNRPLDWPAPNGYPDVATAWSSSGTLLDEWEYHRGFAQNWWKDSGFRQIDLTALYGKTGPKTSGEAINRLTQRITGMTFSATHRTVLQNFLQERSTTPLASSRLKSYLPHLVPLILDAPHHALR